MTLSWTTRINVGSTDSDCATSQHKPLVLLPCQDRLLVLRLVVMWLLVVVVVDVVDARQEDFQTVTPC